MPPLRKPPRKEALEKKSELNPQERSETRCEESSCDKETEEKFERELCWCTEQLNIMLSNADPNKKHCRDYLKALQVLQNPKAPMIKKRQVMSTTFGNYRQKMELEEAKQTSETQKRMKLKPMEPGSFSSTFVKKTRAARKSAPSYTSTAGNNFRFNFSIDEEECL